MSDFPFVVKHRATGDEALVYLATYPRQAVEMAVSMKAVPRDVCVDEEYEVWRHLEEQQVELVVLPAVENRVWDRPVKDGADEFHVKCPCCGHKFDPEDAS